MNCECFLKKLFDKIAKTFNFFSSRYQRDWRYHVDEKIWITRAPGNTNYDKIGTTERGSYIFFDAQNWRKVHKDFHSVDTQKLDKNPASLNL